LLAALSQGPEMHDEANDHDDNKDLCHGFTLSTKESRLLQIKLW